MEQKYYAPQQGLHCLTMATHPGTLTEEDIIDNLVRMIAMEETEEHERTDAKTAAEEIQAMPFQKEHKLWELAVQEYHSPEFQDYLTRKNLRPNSSQKLVPIVEALKEEDWTPTEAEAVKAMWERLDEFSLDEFKMWELPVPEWE